jgi:pimeloyl-ACP methyl ester carboxylesterase
MPALTCSTGKDLEKGKRMVQSLVVKTSANRLSRRSVVGRIAASGAAATTTGLGMSRISTQGAAARVRPSDVFIQQEGSTMTDATTTAHSTPLTVVLVHGAFADASGWAGVIERLQDAGVWVTAPANPLRGVELDSAYIASLLTQIPGPVLAVGHSYGGMVISNAAAKAANVVGLVYVAGFAPDEGESLTDIEVDSRDSVLATSLLPLQYPTDQGTETAVELVIDPIYFHDAFAADLPINQTAVMAAFQRPAAAIAFSEPSGVPAWKTLPSWAVVPTGDKAAGTDVLHTMATRAGAEIVEVEGSHAIMISQPQAVTDLIMTAINAVS